MRACLHLSTCGSLLTCWLDEKAKKASKGDQKFNFFCGLTNTLRHTHRMSMQEVSTGLSS